jgi:hypothetical protein
MDQQVSLIIEAADRERLVTIVSHRNRPRKRDEWVEYPRVASGTDLS